MTVLLTQKNKFKMKEKIWQTAASSEFRSFLQVWTCRNFLVFCAKKISKCSFNETLLQRVDDRKQSKGHKQQVQVQQPTRLHEKNARFKQLVNVGDSSDGGWLKWWKKRKRLTHLWASGLDLILQLLVSGGLDSETRSVKNRWAEFNCFIIGAQLREERRSLNAVSTTCMFNPPKASFQKSNRHWTDSRHEVSAELYL